MAAVQTCGPGAAHPIDVRGATRVDADATGLPPRLRQPPVGPAEPSKPGRL